MKKNNRFWRVVFTCGGLGILFVAGFASIGARESTAGTFLSRGCRPPCQNQVCADPPLEELGGTWYWLRSPEEEKRIVASLYNRYCIRCHGVDGRGVWDIPDVPDFTNARWQACRSDAQLARITLEGRGAVMPGYRGILNLEEAWAMARYLRSFVPGSELSRPDYGPPEKSATDAQLSLPKSSK